MLAWSSILKYRGDLEKHTLNFRKPERPRCKNKESDLVEVKVYSTTSREQADETSGLQMQEAVQRGEGYYLRWGFLLDNPTVERGDSAFWEAWLPACFQAEAWISRSYKVGPP